MSKAFFYGFRISFRRLLKERTYTFINIAGLAISMAAALTIFLYLIFETSFDQHHIHHEKIYRVAVDATQSGESSSIALNTLSLGPMLVDNLPQFTRFVRIFPANFFFRNLVYRYQDKSFQEDGVFASDSTFFDFFTFDFIEGDPHHALTDPFTIVLTQRMAERYFGQQQALGRTIYVEEAGNFTVSAVISNPPANSHMQFHGIFSIATMNHLDHLIADSFMPGVTWQILENNKYSRLAWLYIKTIPGYDTSEFSGSIWETFYNTHIGDISVFDELKLVFQPLADIHLTSNREYEMSNDTGLMPVMSPDLVKIFATIAFFLLAMAAINYTNISLSQIQSRAKEITIKKAMGVTKKNLMIQFFSESMIIALIAFCFALVLMEVAIPHINQIMGTPLSANVFENPRLLILFVSLALFTGFVAGSYPAIYFSGLSHQKILNIRLTTGKSRMRLKKVLIVIQFTLSVFMVIATIVVTQQLAFIHSKDLGFNQENIVVIELQDRHSRENARIIQEKFLESPYITDAATSNYYPSRLAFSNTANISNPRGTLTLLTNIIQVDEHYADFMGIALKNGRMFNRLNPDDYKHAVVINQAAQRSFGWDEALGKYVDMNYTWPDGTTTGRRKVIGVFKDFNYTSLTRPVAPLIVYPMAAEANYINVRLDPAHISSAMGQIKEIWKNEREGYPLNYFFLEDNIARMYESQEVLSTFFTVFAVISIFIAFLGLYGLSAYAVEQRIREIGIRKVLGADNITIILMLAGEFLKLSIVAGIAASIAAYFLLNEWLNTFAYHIQMNILPFTVAIFSAIIIALLAIAIHAWKAAKLNPAEAVRYE